MSAEHPTAVIVDDATFTRQSFPELMPELNVQAGFATPQQLVSSGVRADLVILEVQRADKSVDEVRLGLDGLRLAVAEGHRVCVYTQEARPFIHAACIAAGANGVVSRAESLPVTQRAFLEVARGSTIITQGIINAFDLLSRRQQLTVLTPTQRSILNARARRLTFTDIATQLELPVDVVLDEWRAASAAIARYLQESCLETATTSLGLVAEDLADIWPCPSGHGRTPAPGHPPPSAETDPTLRGPA